jgi:APA family basic amino acid/polyamine antiporter
MKQKLNLFDFTMIVVGLVIGMGIFRTAATSAKAAESPVIFFSAWLIGGLIAFCGALTYAEIGSRFPVNGGYFRIFSYAYHPSIAFAINGIILISNAASLSGVALIGADYLANAFLPNAQGLVRVSIAISAILAFYGVNLLGLKMSARTQNILMMIKISMLLLIVFALFFPHLYADPVSTGGMNLPDTEPWILALGSAMVAVSFTYGGYQQTINFGNEVNEPSKNIPKGIFIGIFIIISLYLLVNFSYYKILGFSALQQNDEIASLLVNKLLGPIGGKIFSLLLFISVLAYVNALLLSNPRVMQAMSEDGVLPKHFSYKTKDKNVLLVSLTVFAAICIIILFFTDEFEEILGFTIFLDCFGMATSAGAIFKLRKSTSHLDGTGIYKLKWYPIQPLIFIIAYSAIAVSIAISQPKTAITGLLVMGAFTIFYFISKGISKKSKTAQ